MKHAPARVLEWSKKMWSWTHTKQSLGVEDESDEEEQAWLFRSGLWGWSTKFKSLVKLGARVVTIRPIERETLYMKLKRL